MALSAPIALLGLIIGGLVLFGLLRFLNRRLRIFTRGTVTFMVVSLVAFTVISVLSMLHDIQLDEDRAREFARRRVVHGAALGWLGGRVTPASRQFEDDFEEDIDDLEDEILEEIREIRGCCSADFDDLELVALDIDWRPSRDYVGSALHRQRRHSWDYDAVMHDSCRDEYHRIKGRIYTSNPRGEGFVISGVKADLVDRGRSHHRICERLMSIANVFREERKSITAKSRREPHINGLRYTPSGSVVSTTTYGGNDRH